MRQLDFACQEADKSIFTVFTETDLRAAHVVTRRIASVLKKIVLAADGKAGVDPAVTLATLKPSDTTDSLIARVVEEPPKPAGFFRLLGRHGRTCSSHLAYQHCALPSCPGQARA